jgi:hypothetical protein
MKAVVAVVPSAVADTLKLPCQRVPHAKSNSKRLYGSNASFSYCGCNVMQGDRQIQN